MENQSPGIVCSGAEIHYFSGLLSSDLLVGIADPFPNLFAYEIDAELRLAQESLFAKRYLQMGEDGQIELDPTATILITVMNDPDLTVICRRYTVETGTSESVYYLRHELIVEVSIESSGSYRIRAIDEGLSLTDQLALLMAFSAPACPTSLDISVRQPALDEARALAAAGQVTEAAATLEMAGLDAEISRSLLQMISSHRRAMATVAISRGEHDWDARWLIALEGREDLLRLLPVDRALDEANMVKVTSVDCDTLCNDMKRLIQSAIAEAKLASGRRHDLSRAEGAGA